MDDLRYLRCASLFCIRLRFWRLSTDLHSSQSFPVSSYLLLDSLRDVRSRSLPSWDDGDIVNLTGKVKRWYSCDSGIRNSFKYECICMELIEGIH
jgi:hypothetical protein